VSWVVFRLDELWGHFVKQNANKDKHVFIFELLEHPLHWAIKKKCISFYDLKLLMIKEIATLPCLAILIIFVCFINFDFLPGYILVVELDYIVRSSL